jgi:predicted nuclease with TOPRIM domain
MSTDRTTEILNYLSAISREVGELRTEMREMRAELNSLRAELGEVRAEQSKLRADLDAVRADVRTIIKRFDRMEAVVLENRADIRDVEDRVAVLEGKQS